MKIFTKKWWTDVPICKECNGTGQSAVTCKVWWQGKQIDVCKKCYGRGIR